jgi:hypothetical protein
MDLAREFVGRLRESARDLFDALDIAMVYSAVGGADGAEDFLGTRA